MSVDLYWRPVVPQKAGRYLPRPLKYIISQRFWGHDGSMWSKPAILDSTITEYLKGIKDASGEEVKKAVDELLDAIEKHERIALWLE